MDEGDDAPERNDHEIEENIQEDYFQVQIKISILKKN